MRKAGIAGLSVFRLPVSGHARHAGLSFTFDVGDVALHHRQPGAGEVDKLTSDAQVMVAAFRCDIESVSHNKIANQQTFVG